MISRIAALLIVTAVCTTALANELFQISALASNNLKGSTFEISLFEDAVIVNPTGTQVRRRSSGFTKATIKLRDLLATGEIRTVFSFQRCNQEVVIRVFACSVETGSTTYNCDYTLLSARLKKGSGGCEL